MTLLLPLLLACSSGLKPGDTSGTGGPVDTDTSSLQAPPLVINEFLAINDTTIEDNAGEFDDWVELYNSGDAVVQFTGLYLSDDPEEPLKWALPSGALDAGAYKLFWCDDDDGHGDSGAPSQGEDHVGFNLSSEGETLTLTYAEGGDSVQVDAIEFGLQQPDVSAARVPDGSLEWKYGTPTPNATNGG